jgi:hypothetical protein
VIPKHSGRPGNDLRPARKETLLEVELLELDGIVEEIEGSARRN